MKACKVKRVQHGRGHTYYDLMMGDIMIRRYAKERDDDLLVEVKARADRECARLNQSLDFVNQDAALRALLTNP